MGRTKADGSPAARTCRYHCCGCGEHFSSLVAFDAHRVGSYEAGELRCEFPEDVRSGRGRVLLRLQTAAGVCRLTGFGEAAPVELWEAA